MPQATATPDQVILNLDLLRAVERLLREAETVRLTRNALMRTLPTAASDAPPQVAVYKCETAK